MKDTIYIYADEGVGSLSLLHIYSSCQQSLGHKYAISILSAVGVAAGQWMTKAVLLIMPGGADLEFLKKLSSYANENIAKYVAEGGRFLGICAGAYYASVEIAFDKGGALEVLGQRPLRFFLGLCQGPLAPYDYHSHAGARLIELYTIWRGSKPISLFYNGGGFFVDAEFYPGVEVIAKDIENRALIISITVGQGRALLSGVHFEAQDELLDQSDDYLSGIVPVLSNSRDQRRMLIDNLWRVLEL